MLQASDVNKLLSSRRTLVCVPGDIGDRAFQTSGVEGESCISEGVTVPLQVSSRPHGECSGVCMPLLSSGVEVGGKKYISPPLGPSRPKRFGDEGVRRPEDFCRDSTLVAMIGVGAWMCWGFM